MLEKEFCPSVLEVDELPPNRKLFVPICGLDRFRPPTSSVKGTRGLATFGLLVLSTLSLVMGIIPVRGEGSRSVSVERLRPLLISRASLVGGLLGRSPKGLPGFLVVGVLGFGPRKTSQGRSMVDRPGGRGSEEEGFFLDLSRWTLSSKTRAMSLTFSSSVSNFHSCTLRASGPKRSLPPTDITSSRSLSRCGRATVGESKTKWRRSMCRCVNSSVAVAPASWAIMWASRAIELALWMRSSTSEMSLWILFFEAESRKKRRTFCWKL